MGLPDILVVSKKDVSAVALSSLREIASELDFEVEHPSSGLDAAIHNVKALAASLNDLRWGDCETTDWLVGRNLDFLSRYLALGAAASPRTGFVEAYLRSPR